MRARSVWWAGVALCAAWPSQAKAQGTDAETGQAIPAPPSTPPPEALPWAPATAELPYTELSYRKVYVHGIEPSVGLDEALAEPLTASFIAAVRESPWAQERQVLGGDEARFNAPQVSTYIDRCSAGPCVVEIARALGCGVAISATVSKVGSAILVDAMAVHAPDGKVLHRFTERVRGRDEAALLTPRGLPKIARKLVDKLPDLQGTMEVGLQELPPPSADAGAMEFSDDALAGGGEPAAAEEKSWIAYDTDGAPPPSDQGGGVFASSSDTAQALTIAGYLGLGVGGAALTAGAVSHLFALSAANTLAAEPHAENQVRSILQQGLGWQTAAFTLYGVGLAVGALGAAGLAGGITWGS